MRCCMQCCCFICCRCLSNGRWSVIIAKERPTRNWWNRFRPSVVSSCCPSSTSKSRPHSSALSLQLMHMLCINDAWNQVHSWHVQVLEPSEASFEQRKCRSTTHRDCDRAWLNFFCGAVYLPVSRVEQHSPRQSTFRQRNLQSKLSFKVDIQNIHSQLLSNVLLNVAVRAHAMFDCVITITITVTTTTIS